MEYWINIFDVRGDLCMIGDLPLNTFQEAFTEVRDNDQFEYIHTVHVKGGASQVINITAAIAEEKEQEILDRQHQIRHSQALRN